MPKEALFIIAKNWKQPIVLQQVKGEGDYSTSIHIMVYYLAVKKEQTINIRNKLEESELLCGVKEASLKRLQTVIPYI